MAGKRKAGAAAAVPARTLTPKEAFAILELQFADLETPPEGFYTMQQLATEWHRSLPVVTHYVRRALREGKAERRDFRVMTGGKAYKAPHYRFYA